MLHADEKLNFLLVDMGFAHSCMQSNKFQPLLEITSIIFVLPLVNKKKNVSQMLNVFPEEIAQE